MLLFDIAAFPYEYIWVYTLLKCYVNSFREKQRVFTADYIWAACTHERLPKNCRDLHPEIAQVFPVNPTSPIQVTPGMTLLQERTFQRECFTVRHHAKPLVRVLQKHLHRASQPRHKAKHFCQCHAGPQLYLHAGIFNSTPYQKAAEPSSRRYPWLLESFLAPNTARSRTLANCEQSPAQHPHTSFQNSFGWETITAEILW